MPHRLFPASVLALVVFLITALSAGHAAADPIRLACVGDSITAGAGAAPNQSWPIVLGRMLGQTYDVHNFGVSGTTMLKKGDNPYWGTAAFTAAQAFQPNIVIITLGTNDTKPQNWDAHSGEFADDTKAMLDVFKNLPSHPRVILALPIPVFADGAYGIRKTIMDSSVQPSLKQTAIDTKTETLDLYDAMAAHGDQVGDTVHPTAVGYVTMARFIFRYLTHGATVTPSAMLFMQSSTVTIVPDADAQFTVYTTDGHVPTRKSPKYSKPFTVKDTCTIRARTVIDGKLGDFVATLTVTKANPQPAVAVSGPQPGLSCSLYLAQPDQLFGNFATLTNPTSSVETQIAIPSAAPAINFGLVFTGYVQIPTTDVYTFSASSDDGSRLFIDGKLLVDNWAFQGPTPVSGDVALQTGYHAIRVEFFQAGGGDFLSASYGTPAMAPAIIPASALFH